jgi:hypothetical protein
MCLRLCSELFPPAESTLVLEHVVDAVCVCGWVTRVVDARRPCPFPPPPTTPMREFLCCRSPGLSTRVWRART